MLGLPLTLDLLRVMRLGDYRGLFYVAFPMKLAILVENEKNRQEQEMGIHRSASFILSIHRLRAN